METSNKRVIDDLIFYYTEKKRLSRRGFNYIPCIKYDKCFEKAASLCEKYEMTPAGYVQFFYARLGNNTAFFNPEHFGGKVAEKALLAAKDNENESYKVEITNSNLPYELLWSHQQELVARYVRNGETVHSVLMDSSLKFFAWFRILSTEARDPEVIQKYQHIARAEMTSDLRDFALRQSLDLDRI